MKFLFGMMLVIIVGTATFMAGSKIHFKVNDPIKEYQTTKSVSHVITVEDNESITAIKRELEKVYYEAQKDYAEGDIRITDLKYDHCYSWTKSPWDGGSLDTIKYVPDCVVKRDSSATH